MLLRHWFTWELANRFALFYFSLVALMWILLLLFRLLPTLSLSACLPFAIHSGLQLNSSAFPSNTHWGITLDACCAECANVSCSVWDFHPRANASSVCRVFPTFSNGTSDSANATYGYRHVFSSSAAPSSPSRWSRAVSPSPNVHPNLSSVLVTVTPIHTTPFIIRHLPWVIGAASVIALLLCVGIVLWIAKCSRKRMASTIDLTQEYDPYDRLSAFDRSRSPQGDLEYHLQ